MDAAWETERQIMQVRIERVWVRAVPAIRVMQVETTVVRPSLAYWKRQLPLMFQKTLSAAPPAAARRSTSGRLPW